MTLNVYSAGAHKAMIVKQTKTADNYRAEEPWLLLWDSGRIDRFATQAEAKDEAIKCWIGSDFRKD